MVDRVRFSLFNYRKNIETTFEHQVFLFEIRVSGFDEVPLLLAVYKHFRLAEGIT